MSAAPPVSPPFAQLPARGEHLAVHTRMDGIHSHQSLPLTGESIDQVQSGLDAQADEILIDGDHAQIDELAEDINEGLQSPSNPDPRVNGEHINGEPGPTETSQLADQIYGQDVVTTARLDQVVPIEEPTEELPQTDIEINSLLSETYAMLPAEALSATTATGNGDYVSLEEQDNLEIPEGDLQFSVPLTKQGTSIIAETFAPKAEEITALPSEGELSEHDSNRPDIQTAESEPVVAPEPVVESHQEVDAPPLRRMDDDTIPLTAHSEDSVIEVLQDAPDTPTDKSIQLATPEEQTPQESEPIAPTEIVPEQVDMEVDIQDVVQPEELVSASVMVDIEYIEILGPKEGEGEDTAMEPLQPVVEQGGEPAIDTTTEESGDHQPDQFVQEGPTPAVPDESAAPDPLPDDTITTSGDAAGPIVTFVEESTTITEQTSIEQAEQSGPSVVDPAPVVIMDATTTSVATTLISTDPVIDDSAVLTADLGDMESDHIERAAQVQQEQDATAQTAEDETQATLVVESVATPNNTIVTDDIPDPTAPKDSDSPLRRTIPQSQSQSQPDPVAPQPADPNDPLVIQDGIQDGEVQTHGGSSEPSKPQYQVSTNQPETTSVTEPSIRQTPEWEGFAALDEDAPISPAPEPSSEPSEYPDVVTEDPSVNLTSASTDKAEEPSNSPTAPAPRRKKKKPKLIMEVVIPIARDKSKVMQEIKVIKKRRPGRPPKAAKAPAPSKPELPAASSSSPTRRSSSVGTPSPVKSEASEPASRLKKPVAKRPMLSNSHKRGKKAVASGSSTGTRPVHVAHSSKLEVVIPRKPRLSVLKGVGSTPSGNNVKFASVSPATRKRKAESEPDADEEETDADADGETDDDYEDIEEEPKIKVEVVISPRKRQKKTKAFIKGRISPVKRPRRSTEARKTPAKTPEIISKSPRSASKRRRLRR
ncbi:hypothetical protein B0J17DRAFT_642820 [Rhizoctonia solani]|nr:hypothetical protein B0J17DRAFT_642820 [Rhizoctonia solani]